MSESSSPLQIGQIDVVSPTERSASDRWKNWVSDEDRCKDAEEALRSILDDATPFAHKRWSKYREWEAVYRGEYETTYYVGRTRVQARFLERATDLITSACEREL